MAMPPLTLENIKHFIDDIPHQELSNVCTNGDLQELSSSNGAPLVVQGKPSNVRIGWHLNETNQIDGIFLRIYNNEYLQAWKILPDQNMDEPYQLTVTPQHTTLSKTIFIHATLSKEIFDQCAGVHHKKTIVFQAEHLQHPDQIRDFFAKNQDMLPDSIRQRGFPEVPPKKHIDGKGPAAPKSDNTYLYIAGALLFVFGIAFVAKRYFAAPKEV